MTKKSRYRKATPSEQRALRRNLDFIREIGQFTEENLTDKEIHIVTSSQHLEMIFNKNNLLHLLGLEYVHGNQQFWSDFSARKMQVEDMRIQSFTLEKLQVMHAFPSLFLGEAVLTEELILRNIVIDKALRTRKLVLAIGLDKDQRLDFYFARSAISLKNYKLTLENGERVLEVFTIDRKTGEKQHLKKNHNK